MDWVELYFKMKAIEGIAGVCAIAAAALFLIAVYIYDWRNKPR